MYNLSFSRTYLMAFALAIGWGVFAFSPESDTLFTIASGDLSVHFLELGNKYAGDCIYIKANDNDILIDAGSRQNSATTIINYVNNYCKDGKLEYLVATHAHQDHIAAFPSTNSRDGIFKAYEVENIIDFGEASKYGIRNTEYTEDSVYGKYVAERTEEISAGANWFPVSNYNQPDFQKVFDLGDGITLTILDNYYYYNQTSDENNYSVCLLISQGSNNILLTGDLELEGEEYLVQKNTLPECVLFKAGHHGSKTSSNNALLEVIKPKNVVFTCCAGATEYTTNHNNTFPTQDAINRIAKYTKNCYVTTVCTNTKTELDNEQFDKFESMNGDIIFTSNKNGYSINCTNNNTILKETTWFAENRTWPADGIA